MNENNETLYADIQESKFSRNNFFLVIKKCPYCKMEHVHSGEQGHRAAHCFDKKTGKKIAVDGYFVEVDWNEQKNIQQRDEYENFLERKANEYSNAL